MASKNKKTETLKKAGATVAPLTINAQYVKDLSFENPHPLEHAKDPKTSPEITVNINVNARLLQKRTYEVDLHIKADAKKGKNAMFMAEILYAGVFTLGDRIEEKSLSPVLMIECPRLLFPFARAILANLTREGGYPPLSLHLVDFVDLYRRKYAQAQPQAGKSKTKH